jgi:aspartyl-tRNA(Asn)/glutamyl-tRNA(Gln) amidotransferase subunit B
MNDTLIGLEIHCQLTGLESKLLCSCSASYRNLDPNVNICPTCCGLPGSLPMINKKAIEYAAMISAALQCKIPEKIVFYRKNYFYPDLPKNFQITQYNEYGCTSIGSDGILEYSKMHKVRIRRIQLEEDPGRLSYDGGANKNIALIDYNRAGISLAEIITEPDFDNPVLVRMFLNNLTSILEHLGVCDPSLEGAVRCDVNISMKGKHRVEVKNVNSFKDVERALNYEISRQSSLISHNIEVRPETRHWDDQRKITKSSRSKEAEHDYRYFPEPDIPAIILGSNFESTIHDIMPELPDKRIRRFLDDYNISEHACEILINHKYFADFFEEAVKIHHSPVEISNWIVTDLKGLLGDELENKLASSKIEPKHIAELVKLVDDKRINRTIAKQVLTEIFKTGLSPLKILVDNDYSRIDDKIALAATIDLIFKDEILAVNDAKANPNAVNYLLGKVMKYTKGRADPKTAVELINDKLQLLN